MVIGGFAGIPVLGVYEEEFGYTWLIDSRLEGKINESIEMMQQPPVIYTHTWAEAISEVTEVYSQSCYGALNAMSGGLISEEYGIPYMVSSTVREWSEGDAFQSGQTGWRAAQVPLTIAAGVQGYGLITDTRIEVHFLHTNSNPFRIWAGPHLQGITPLDITVHGETVWIWGFHP